MDLYDEFGNYVGPNLDEDDDDMDEAERSEFGDEEDDRLDSNGAIVGISGANTQYFIIIFKYNKLIPSGKMDIEDRNFSENR